MQVSLRGAGQAGVARVEVLDPQDTVVVSAGLSCGTDIAAPCRVDVPFQPQVRRWTVKFFDGDNRLMYAKDQTTTGTRFVDVDARDARGSGPYFFRTFGNRYGYTSQALAQELTSIFPTQTAGVIDYFDQLENYYQHLRASGKMDESSFYATLDDKLRNREHLTGSWGEGLTSSVKINECAISTTLGSVFAGVSKLVPNLKEVGQAIFGAISLLSGNACKVFNSDPSLSDIKRELDEISKQLTLLTNKVNSLQLSIDELLALMELQVISDSVTSFVRVETALQDSLNSYANMLSTGGTHASLAGYVSTIGGFNRANVYPGTPLHTLLQGYGQQLDHFNDLADANNPAGTGRLYALTYALGQKCAQSSRIAGDVIAARNNCNLLLAQLTARFLQVQTSMALALKDQANLIATEAARTGADMQWFNTVWVSPVAGHPRWADVPAYIDTLFQRNAQAGATALAAGFIEALHDFPADLSNGLSRVGCINASGRAEPVAWYVNSATPDADFGRYITTECPFNGGYVRSDFRYGTAFKTSDLRLVLGVLVDSRASQSSRFTDRSGNWLVAGSITADQGFANALGATVPGDRFYPDRKLFAPGSWGLAVRLDRARFHVTNQDLLASGVDLNRSDTSVKYAESCDWGNYLYWAGNYRYVMRETPVAWYDDGNAYFTSRLQEDNYCQSRGNEYLAATLSYTADANTPALVWQVEVTKSHWLYYSGPLLLRPPYRNQWRLRCVTDECSANGNSLVFKSRGQTRTVTLVGDIDSWKTFQIQ